MSFSSWSHHDAATSESPRRAAKSKPRGPLWGSTRADAGYKLGVWASDPVVGLDAAWGIYKCTHGSGANTSLHIASAFRYGTSVFGTNLGTAPSLRERISMPALSRAGQSAHSCTRPEFLLWRNTPMTSWASRGARGKELDGPDYDLERSPMREACWTMSRRKIMSNTSVQPSTPEFAAVVTSH